MNEINLTNSQKQKRFLSFPLSKRCFEYSSNNNNLDSEIEKFKNDFTLQENMFDFEFIDENKIRVKAIFFGTNDVVEINGKYYLIEKVQNNFDKSEQILELKDIKEIEIENRKFNFNQEKIHSFEMFPIRYDEYDYFEFDYFEYLFNVDEVILKPKEKYLTIKENINGFVVFEEDLTFVEKEDIKKKYVFIIDRYSKNINEINFDNEDEKNIYYKESVIATITSVNVVEDKKVFIFSDLIDEKCRIRLVLLQDLVEIINGLETKKELEFNIDDNGEIELKLEINHHFKELKFKDYNKSTEKIILKGLNYNQKDAKFEYQDILEDGSCKVFFSFNNDNLSEDNSKSFSVKSGLLSDYPGIFSFYKCMNNTEYFKALDTMGHLIFTSSDLNLDIEDFTITFFLKHGHFCNLIDLNSHFVVIEFDNYCLLFEIRANEKKLYFVLTDKNRVAIKLNSIECEILKNYNHLWQFYNIRYDNENNKIILEIEIENDKTSIELDVSDVENFSFGKMRKVILNENNRLNFKIKNLRVFDRKLSDEEINYIKKELGFLLKRKPISELTDVYVDIDFSKNGENKVDSRRADIISNSTINQINLKKGDFETDRFNTIVRSLYENDYGKTSVIGFIDKEYNLGGVVISFWMKHLNIYDYYWWNTPARGIISVDDFAIKNTYHNLTTLRVDLTRKKIKDGIKPFSSLQNDYNHFLVYFRLDGIIEIYFNKKLLFQYDIKNINVSYEDFIDTKFILGKYRFELDSHNFLSFDDFKVLKTDNLTDELIENLYNKEIKYKKITDEVVYQKGDINV